MILNEKLNNNKKDLRTIPICNLKSIKVDHFIKCKMIKLSEIKTNLKSNLKLKAWQLKNSIIKKQNKRWYQKEKTKTSKKPHKNEDQVILSMKMKKLSNNPKTNIKGTQNKTSVRVKPFSIKLKTKILQTKTFNWLKNLSQLKHLKKRNSKQSNHQ